MAGARYMATRPFYKSPRAWLAGALGAGAVAGALSVDWDNMDNVKSGAFGIPEHECVDYTWKTHTVREGDRMAVVAQGVRDDYIAEARECGIEPHKRDHNYQTWLERIREINPELAEKIYIHPGDEIRYPDFECTCGDEGKTGE